MKINYFFTILDRLFIDQKKTDHGFQFKVNSIFICYIHSIIYYHVHVEDQRAQFHNLDDHLIYLPDHMKRE